MGQVLQIFPENPFDVELLRLNVARLTRKQNLDPSKISITYWDDEVCVEIPHSADVAEFKEMLNAGFAPARVEEYEDGE